jgi:hypothetical protein
MFKRSGQWLLPAGSFGLALVLAMVAGPAFRAMAVRAQQATTCPCKLTVMEVSSTVTAAHGKKHVLTAFTITEGARICASGNPTDSVTATATIHMEVSWTAVCTMGAKVINDAGTTDEDIALGPSSDIFNPPCNPAVHVSPGWTDNLAGLTATVSGTLAASEMAKNPGFACVVTVTAMKLAPLHNAASSKVHAVSTCGGNSTCSVAPRIKMGAGMETHTCAKNCP